MKEIQYEDLQIGETYLISEYSGWFFGNQLHARYKGVYNKISTNNERRFYGVPTTYLFRLFLQVQKTSGEFFENKEFDVECCRFYLSPKLLAERSRENRTLDMIMESILNSKGVSKTLGYSDF